MQLDDYDLDPSLKHLALSHRSYSRLIAFARENRIVDKVELLDWFTNPPLDKFGRRVCPDAVLLRLPGFGRGSLREVKNYLGLLQSEKDRIEQRRRQALHRRLEKVERIILSLNRSLKSYRKERASLAAKLREFTP